MGDLVSLAEWRRKKEEEAHQKELDEIERLRAELHSYIADLPEEAYGGMFVSEEDEVEAFHQRIISSMLRTLDGYSNWPIDSSDM